MSMQEIGDSVRREASYTPFQDIDAARYQLRNAMVALEGSEAPELTGALHGLERAYNALGSAATGLVGTVDGANDYLAYIGQPGIAGFPGWSDVPRGVNGLTGRRPGTKAFEPGRLTTRKLESWVIDEIDRQYEDGITRNPQSSVVDKLAKPHAVRRYEDAEPYRIGKDTIPASLMVRTLDDFRQLLHAIEKITGAEYKTLEETVLHEREHVQFADALVDMFGTLKGGIGEVAIGCELRVTGRPRWAGFGRKKLIPLVVQPFTTVSNLTVPAIALPLLSAIPTVLSESDKVAIVTKGRKNKQEVLRRAALYNERPGVRPLPLPRNQ